MLKLENPLQRRVILETDRSHWPKERLEARLAEHAAKHPDKIALVDPWRRLTYSELDRAINDVAVNMKRLGLAKNSVVLIQLPNIAEGMIAFHATLRSGAIVLPVTPIYRESEIREIIKQVDPDLIIVPEYFRKRNYVEMYSGISELAQVPVVGVKITGEPGIGEGKYIRWDAFLHNPHGERLKELDFDPNEYGLLMFTSGTTSSPKGVLHTHATLGYAVDTFDGMETTGPSSSFFVPSPITHITGVVVGILGPMRLGAKSVFMPVWEAAAAYDTIEQEKCNYVMASTPFLSQLIRECEKRNKGLDTLTYFSCGGADVSAHLLQHSKEIIPGCTFSRIYGSTESPGISKFRKGFPEKNRYFKDGRPSDPCRARLKAGSELPDGTGELEVYGPQLFMRYISWPQTVEAFNQEWFSTGDLGLIDIDGFVEITGRKKDIIIRGGENISAKEIEDILIAHPSIENVAIVGYKDEVMGERACAFVVLKPGVATIGLREMATFLDERKVAKQKWPERLEIVNELPLTHSGKIQKFVLREWINHHAKA